MTYLKFLALSLFTWALVACGGANGAGPIGNSVALYISAPNSVTLAAAASSSYMIGGGVAPYTASSGNSAVATVTVSGTALSITGVAAGTAQITVLDAAGKSVSSTVTVDPSGIVGKAGSITLGLRDANNLSTLAISAAGVTTARALVLDAASAPVAGKLVSFSGDAAIIKFISPASGQVLTDANGIASVRVGPANISATGAGTLTAASSVGGVSVTGTMDYQLSAANVALNNLNLGAANVAAYGNRAVSVSATINGANSSAVPVQVSFVASCGTVSPALISTDGAGTASTTYTAGDPNCAGSNVTITASSPGASSVSGSLAVSPTVGTNLLFVSAEPALIYLTGSVGATQAIVSFKVVDASGNPLQNQSVQLALSNTATGTTLGTLGENKTVTLTSNALGVVAVPVFSGTVPSSLQVNAVLKANPGVTTNSNILTVASGRPVPSRISLMVKNLAIEGQVLDGSTTPVTVYMADRQGNPVPDGTNVNFVSSGGTMIPASCVVTGGASSCSVAIRSGNPRPMGGGGQKAGRVAILAYVSGEEDFVDANGNNVYDPGEGFTDLGNAYRDDNENGQWDLGEFFVPRAGSSTCTGGVNGKANTCDGVWGPADVRAQAIVIFASSTAVITMQTNPAIPTHQSFVVADANGNSIPTGSKIAIVTPSKIGSTCLVNSINGLVPTIDSVTFQPTPIPVPNSLLPTTVDVGLSACIKDDEVDIVVTSPSGWMSSMSFSLP